MPHLPHIYIMLFILIPHQILHLLFKLLPLVQYLESKILCIDMLTALENVSTR